MGFGAGINDMQLDLVLDRQPPGCIRYAKVEVPLKKGDPVKIPVKDQNPETVTRSCQGRIFLFQRESSQKISGRELVCKRLDRKELSFMPAGIPGANMSRR